MKQLTSIALLSTMIGSSYANLYREKLFNSNSQIQRGRLGAMEITDWTEEGFNKVVIKPERKLYQDYVQQTEFLQEAMDQININKKMMENNEIYTCANREVGSPTDPGYFIPAFVADLTAENNSATYEGMCFQELTFQYNPNFDESGNITNVTLNINARKPKSLFCKDWFFIGNTEIHHVETITSQGNHQVTFTNLDTNTQIDLGFGGLKVYQFCEGYVDAFISVFKSLMCFIGGLGTDPNGGPIKGSHVPTYMENMNVKFLNTTMGYELQPREIQDIDYDTDLIQSGDFIAIMRLDGIDPIIMYGSGTHAGHSTMALRFDGELYIVESQDGWYWPVHGIQRNKFDQWMEWARNADFHVVHLPLKPEAREKFNEAAAQEFFFQTEGLPYGYHNFLFGWIDTADDNWPPLLPKDFVPIVFSILEEFLPESADIFYDQAINKRLGTVGLNIPDLAAEAARQGMSLDQVMAMPEIDGWEYTGEEPRDGVSYVCSAYVAAMYKAAGLFDDLEINATEFTPKDVYTLDFFDTNFQRPQACQEADPDQPYCQLTGKYRMTFPGYSTISPYNLMCQTCPTLAPDFYRPDGC